MSLKGKYESLYKEQLDVCGAPFAEFVVFAEQYQNPSATVLDLGSGQGRDACLFARHGMQVTGVDISPTGVKQMLNEGKKEGLAIEGVVSDILDFSTDAQFDIILLDRTLHMLSTSQERLAILDSCSRWLKNEGHILIADESANILEFIKWFEQDKRDWEQAGNMKRGFCFMQLQG